MMKSSTSTTKDGVLMGVVVTATAVGVGIGMVAGSFLQKYLPVHNHRGTFWRRRRLASRPSYKPGQTPSLPWPTFGQKIHVFDPSQLKSAYNLIISAITP
mmetsp:Transcript_88005/g.172163  ORF Transcript_88005/g.172163 Transcript_88005/m.172163 type:complete len:100 (+) Transcript_88005:69-368(+)